MRVLVVEDDLRMAGLLKRGLEQEAYSVDVASTGEEALWLGKENPYDAMVLDVKLPDIDGYEVCRQLRSSGRWMPVLMLTARDAVSDRVAGLDAGADDYLTKPFSFVELFARLRALIRRGSSIWRRCQTRESSSRWPPKQWGCRKAEPAPPGRR
ncbi:MAG: response regulator transcription factor [Actinomycetota bacterium]